MHVHDQRSLHGALVRVFFFEDDSRVIGIGSPPRSLLTIPALQHLYWSFVSPFSRVRGLCPLLGVQRTLRLMFRAVHELRGG